jgi:hypothetical protein
MGTIAWTQGDSPLVPFAAGYERKLLELGHKPGAVAKYLGLMGQLSRWLAGEGLGVGDLTPARVHSDQGRHPGRRAGQHNPVPRPSDPRRKPRATTEYTRGRR